MWRPLEEKDEEEVVDRSAALQKRKRKSPAAAARSRQRFLQRQEKRNTHRLQLESRNTPHRSIETSKTWTRLTKRLENKHILNTSKGGGADLGAGGGGAAGKTVLYCNQTKTIVHPQLLQSPLSSFSPVTSSTSGKSDSRWQAGCYAPTVSKICSRCHVWAFKLQHDYIVPLLQRCKYRIIVTIL